MTRTCLASLLGGCDAMSCEHVISRGLFGDAMVGSEGLPFSNGRSIHAGRISARILCISHNRALSPLDAEVIKIRNAVLRFHADGEPSAIGVSGRLVERWMLKYAIGGIFAGWYRELRPPGTAMIPCLFGLQPLPPHVSMFGVEGVVRRELSRQSVATHVVWDTNAPEKSGWLVSLFGFPVFLSLGLAAPADAIVKGGPIKGAWMDVDSIALFRHPPFITMTNPVSNAMLVINLDWD